MDQEPNGPRSQAALIVSLVLLIGGFGVFIALLFHPPPLGVTDPSVTYGLLGWFAAIMAGITLMLRYWFPPKR